MILFELLAAVAILVPCGAALHYRRRLASVENESARRLETLERARESKYRTLTENADDVVVRYDLDCRRTYVNPAWERINGATAAVALGKTPTEMAPRAKPVAAEIEATLRRAMADGRTYQMEFCWEDEAGGKVWYELRATPECGADGAVAGVLTVARDISARKRLEAELHEKTLLHETLLNALKDAGMQLMLIENGRIAYVGNRTLARQAGWSDEEIDARPPLFDLIHPDDRARVAGYHRRRLAGEAVPARYELALIGPGGARIEYEAAVALVPGSGSARAVSIGWEIGERKRAERDLLLLRRAIDQSSEGYFLMDEQWRVVDTNAAACASLGLRREELLGLTPLDFNPDTTRAVLDGRMAAEPGVSTIFETSHRAIDGRIFPVEISGSVFVDGSKRYALTMVREISKRKRIEDELRRSERQFRAIAENTDDLIFRYNPDCRRSYVNPAVSKLFRKPPEALLGATAGDNGRLDDRNRYLEAIRRVFAKGEIEYIQLGYILDDQKLDFDVQLIPETDENGRVISVFSMAHDISERKRVEAALRQRAELQEIFSSLAKAVPGFLFTIRVEADGRAHFPYASAGVVELFGLTPEAIRADAVVLRARYHPDDLERGMASLAESARTMRPHRVEMRVLHVEKGLRWVEVRATPNRREDGAIEWHGIMLDITVRKRMELALDKERAILKTFFGALPDLAWMKDTEGRYLACNPLFEQLYDATEAEILGKTDFDFVDAELASFFRLKDKEAEAAGRPCVNEEWATFAVSGRRALLETVKSPVVDADGKIIGVIGVAHDITERKKAEEEIQRSEQLLRTMIDASPDWIFIKDREHRYRLVNQGYANALHIPPEAFIGKNDLDLGFPEELVKGNPEKGIRGFWADDRRVLDSNETQIYSDDPATIDGVVHTFHTIKLPLRDANGYPWGVLAYARDITERKAAEQKLQEALAINRGVIDAIPDILFEMDRNGRYLNACSGNPHADKAQLDNLLGKTVRDVLSPEAADVAMSALREAEANGIAYGKVIAIVQPDGELRWYEHSLAKRQDSPPDDPRFIVLSRDVTERKRLEDELRRREEEFRVLAENSPDAIFRFDREGRGIYVNKRVLDLTQRPKGELVGVTAQERRIVDTAQAEMVQRVVRRVLETGEPGECEATFIAPDGRAMIFQNRYMPEFDAAGKVASVVGMCRDITAYRQALELLSSREAEFRSLAENSPDPIMRYDLDCRRIYVNPSYARDTGRTVEEILMSLPANQWMADASMSAEDYMRILRRTMSSGKPEETLISWRRPTDGIMVNLALRIVPERAPDGTVIGALSIGRDIAVLKAIERDLEKSQKQLQALLAHRENAREEERRRIARDLHEELGQLLTALRMSITTLPLQYGTALPALRDRSRAMTELIDRTIKSMRDTVVALRPTALDAGLVAGIEWLAGEFARHGGLVCRVKLPEKEPSLDEARAIAIFRIVQEALTNVARHAGARHADIALEAADSHWRLEIRDDGHGFDPAAPGRKGFGLIGMHERVTMLGGELRLDSTPGRGTAITVFLPLEDAASAAQANRAAPPVPQGFPSVTPSLST